MKQNSWVIITGTSAGIGAAAATLLLERGHAVITCVRKDKELAAWREKGAHPILLDVTKPEQIAQGLARVSELTADATAVHLVNNAGIAVAGPVEALPMARWREQFDVNVFGLVEVTRAFLPLIRKTRGRVVNVSSISGRFVTPYLGAYSASKFAVEAISDALRRELRQFGVHVSLIEPGPIATPIWEKNLKKKEDEYSSFAPELRALYQPELDRLARLVEKSVADALPVSRVADLIRDAIESPRPRARYLVGKGLPFQLALNAVLPERWIDQLVAGGFGRK